MAVTLLETGGDTANPGLGSGTGNTFYEGRLELSSDTVLVGSSILITVNGVDKNSSNINLTSEYLYTFESSCMSAVDNVFSISETVSLTNLVTSTYRNLSCTSGDTITVKLFEKDANTSSDLPLATATASIETALPKIGTGFGASFNEGEIEGNLDLSGDSETDLSASVVNPLEANVLVLSSDYIIEWHSSCATAEFSVQRQTLETGLINTRYTTDIDSCLSVGDPGDAGYDSKNTITLILYERNQSCDFSDTSGCTAVLTKELDVQEGLDPKLGVIDDDDNFYQELLVNDVRQSEYGDPLPDSDTVADSLKLSAGGTMLIRTNIVDGNDGDDLITGTQYGVRIDSSCVEDGTATLDALEKTTTSGEIRFTYTADGCLQDSFTADLYSVIDGTLATKINDDSITGVIYIHPVEIGAILFDSISQNYISLKNIGDAVLPKQSIVTFTVLDEIGGPIIGQVVDFELNNITGGITLGSGEVTDSDVTDANGQVTVIINSGTSHAVTSVRASTTTSSGNIISTDSQPVTVTSGIADQDSFEVSVDTLNPGAFDINGTTVTVTAYAADQYQNPVANDTAINFTAESGIITSSCLTANGSCSVTWTSAGVRPGQHDSALERANEVDPQDASQTVLGLTTIMAYTTGEAGYTDQDGNGQFNLISGSPELFIAKDEAFRDDDWDNALDVSGSNGSPVEFFADFNSDGTHSAAPSHYQGAVCSETLLDTARNSGTAEHDEHCEYMMHVRSQVRIMQSTADTYPQLSIWEFDGTNYTQNNSLTLSGVTGATDEFYVLVQDANGNIPASGSSLNVSSDGYTVNGGGAIANSLGLLQENDSRWASGLPSFGQLFNISYIVEDTPISIELYIQTREYASDIIRLNP
jgi:hypothetical protein